MSLPLTRDDVISRMRDFPSDNYAFIGNVVKGLALSIATAVLFGILVDFRSEWMRLLPWLTSIAAMFVTHMTWSRGVILSNARANLLDTVFPMLTGMSEFFLFAILLPLPDGAHPNLWLNWFACSGTHTLLGGAIAHNRVRGARAAIDFDHEMLPLGMRYLKWIREDRMGASGLGTAAWLLWSVVRLYVYPRFGPHVAGLVQGVVSVPFTIVLGWVMFRASSERQEIDRYVSSTGPCPRDPCSSTVQRCSRSQRS